jgi:hypothetical protein
MPLSGNPSLLTGWVYTWHCPTMVWGALQLPCAWRGNRARGTGPLARWVYVYKGGGCKRGNGPPH